MIRMLRKLKTKKGETLAEALVSVLIISLSAAFLVTGIRAASVFFEKGSPSDLVFNLQERVPVNTGFSVRVVYKGMEKDAKGLQAYAIEKEGSRAYVYYEAQGRP